MNIVILSGNLVKNPEGGTTSNGKTFAKFDLAVNDYYGGKDNVTFVKVSAWGANADFVNMYVTKGDNVVVSGKLKAFDYETKEGTRKSGLEILASTIEFNRAKNKEVAKEKEERHSYEETMRADAIPDYKDNSTSEVDDDGLPLPW